MIRKRLLLVEDEYITAMNMRRMLEKSGYEVLPVIETGESAVAAALECSPDLVLMDIILKGEMNGIEAVKKIREGKDIPVIYVTGNSDRETIRKAQDTEHFRILIKPVSSRDLNEAIASALAIHRMEVRLRSSEERFRMFFDKMHDGIMICRPAVRNKYTIIEINRAIENLSGRSKENAAGKNIREVFPGLINSDFIDLLNRVRDTGCRGSCSFPYKDNTGMQGHYRVNAGLLGSGEILCTFIEEVDKEISVPGDHGNDEDLRTAIDELIAFKRDMEDVRSGLGTVSDEYQEVSRDFTGARHELESIKKRYHYLLSHMIDGYALLDIVFDEAGSPVDYRFVETNSSLQGFTEYRGDITGKSIKEVFPDAENSFRNAVEAMGNQEKFIKYEYHFITGDTWFEVTVLHHENDSVACFFMDITERKKAEHERRLNETRLQALVDLNRMSGADDQDIIDYARDQAVKLTGSMYGFVAFMDGDNSIIEINSWTNNVMIESGIENILYRYSLDKAGLWAEPVRLGKPLIINDMCELPTAGVNYPEGHVGITRYLAVPVYDRERIIGMAGVANKKEEYNESDARQLTLFMEGMWHILTRKRAEKELHQSRGIYQDLVENMNDVICGFDTDMKITFVSPVIQKITGHIPEMMIGRPIKDYIWHEDLEHVRMVIRSFRNDWSGVYEMRLVSADGSLRYVRCSSTQIKKNDRIIGYVSVITDINEEKMAREELREKTEGIQRIIDTMPVMVLAYDTDNNIIFWNRECEHITGFRSDEIIGKTASVLYPDEDLLAERNRKREERGNTFRDMELELVSKNGTHKIISWSNISEQYPVQGFFGWAVGVDVTDMRKTRDRLKIQLEAADNAMTAFGLNEGIGHFFEAAIIVSGMDSGLLYLKDKKSGGFNCIKSRGFSKEYLDVTTSIAPDSECAARFNRGLADYGNLYEISDTMKDISKKEGILSFASAPLLVRGEVIGAFFLASHSSKEITLISRGIFEVLAYQAGNAAARLQAEEFLKSSLREKELLLKEIHHRVKNNMQIIISMLSLQYDYIISEKDRELFVRTENRIRSMALVHEMLYRAGDFSQINFSEYLHDLIDEISMAYARPGIHVQVTINSDNIFLGIDTAIPCGLIINELVTNSFMHAFHGIEKGSIVIDFHMIGDNCVMGVMDNGTGFEGEPDFADTKSMGMSLVYGLALQIGGSIAYNCTEGSQFVITWPCPDIHPLAETGPSA